MNATPDLVAPFLRHVTYSTPLSEIRNAIAPLQPVALSEVSWNIFPYKPAVTFVIAHTPDSIILRYNVRERHIRAVYRNTNDPVYKDSCVEFFLSFDGTSYYNLEFNCMGTGLTGYGPAVRDQRERLPSYLIEKVLTDSVINTPASPAADTSWELLLHIPFELFYRENLTALSGEYVTANFYKCGDELPEPHYVSWKRIGVPNPDFHRPEFFGTLLFE